MRKHENDGKTTADLHEDRKRGILVRTQLYVVVTTDDRYFTYGETNKKTGKPTRRTRYLNEFLNNMGGISDNVEPGIYILSLSMNWRLQVRPVLVGVSVEEMTREPMSKIEESK